MRARNRSDKDKALLLDDRASAARYSIGVSTLRNISDEIGAVVRLGRIRRNNIQKLDRYFGIVPESEPVEEG